jgi:hypothetical protein
MVNTFHDELRALVRAFGEADPANRIQQFNGGIMSLMGRVLGLAEMTF